MVANSTAVDNIVIAVFVSVVNNDVMHLIYLIAAYNEIKILPILIQKFDAFTERNLSFQVYVLDNASTDGSHDLLLQLAQSRPWLQPVSISEKGLGIAFRKGLELLQQQRVPADSWIVFNAADLPFNFTDLDSFLLTTKKYPACELFIGSKYHPQSVIKRSFKRWLGSQVFFLLRVIVLQLTIKDTQGTLFLKGSQIYDLKPIAANDYFFTTELIYNLKFKTSIMELPIVYEETNRPSSVHLLKDGYRSLKQLIKLRLR